MVSGDAETTLRTHLPTSFHPRPNARSTLGNQRAGDAYHPYVHSLRSRILASTLLIAGLAVVGFGVPLGAAITSGEHDRTVLTLEREATHLLATVPDETLRLAAAGQPVHLPVGVLHAPPMSIGVYSAAGRRLYGAGPIRSRLAGVATGLGHQLVGQEDGQLVVALSLRADRPSTAAVRVAVNAGDLTEDSRLGWLAMLGLAVLILSVAGGVASVLARRLTRPLEKLAADARLLGDGDFTIRTPSSDLAEIDAVGTSLAATAARLGSLLQRERAFSSNASHQIRSPLTALRLNLELVDSPAALAAAIAQLDRLEATLDGLLALTRDIEPPQAPFSLAPLVEELAERWAPLASQAGRRLVVGLPAGLPRLRGSAASLSHVLDVLVDNALQHGAGDVTVSARCAGAVVSVDVADAGPGISGDGEALFQRRNERARGHGIGLSLARSLVEADGGRLELRRPGPHPVFTVVLPADLGAVPVGAGVEPR